MNSREAMFAVQIAWLLGLGALAVEFLRERLALPESLGSVPIGVVWFGALGAVLISLTGIVDHAEDWDGTYVLWHLSRPLMGASLAVVSVLIMQAGILAVGSAPTSVAQTATAPKNILFYLIAFLVGYREETFRELIKRLVDLVLAPSMAPAPPAAAASKNAAPPVVAGSNAPATVGQPAGAAMLQIAAKDEVAEQP